MTYELPAMSSATVSYDSCRRSLAQHDRNFETKFLDLETMLAANFNLARLPFLGVACKGSASLERLLSLICGPPELGSKESAGRLYE